MYIDPPGNLGEQYGPRGNVTTAPPTSSLWTSPLSDLSRPTLREERAARGGVLPDRVVNCELPVAWLAVIRPSWSRPAVRSRARRGYGAPPGVAPAAS
jgi:hypothetical protein